MEKTKSDRESNMNLVWKLCQCMFIHFKNWTTLVRDVDWGGAVHTGNQGYMKTAEICCEPKTKKKEKSLKIKV